MDFSCIDKVELKELYNVLPFIPPGLKIYLCRKILFRGKDVTKFLRGMYRWELNEIWLTPYATPRTVLHELAHAILCMREPELCQRHAIDAAIRPLLRIEIEKKVEEITRELERKVDLSRIEQILQRYV